MSKNLTPYIFWMCFVAASQAGCSARSMGSPGTPGACTPSRTEACSCADGAAGARFCQSDQTFTACVCSGLPDGGVDVPSPDVPSFDGAPVVDAPPDVSPIDVAPLDVTVPDASMTYPPGPYGTRVCARFQPFTLNTCDGVLWDFAQDGFVTSSATVVFFCAGWSVPCQMQASQIEAALSPYRSQNVRVVQALVQNTDRTAVSSSFCRTWRERYRLTIPVVMDPAQTLLPHYPALTFPASLIVDREGRIRYREYGAESGLASLRAALDDVLAAPDTCTP